MSNTKTEDVIASAIKKEKDEGKYILERFQRKLKAFEDKYDIETDDFVEKFESGELDDREDFFEWISVHKGREHWKKKIENLERATK